MKFKIDYVERGLCRIVYKAENDSGQTVYFCFQDEGDNYGGIVLYNCSNDLHEPSHRVKPKAGLKYADLFEVPKGEDELSTRVREFILNN